MLNQSDVDKVFHALADGSRRAMLERLGHGPLSVSELARPMGISLAAVVQHLAVLEESRMVRTEKVGRVRSCHLEPAGLAVATRWIEARKSLWETRFDKLGTLLDELDVDSASGDEKGTKP